MKKFTVRFATVLGLSLAALYATSMVAAAEVASSEAWQCVVGHFPYN